MQPNASGVLAFLLSFFAFAARAYRRDALSVRGSGAWTCLGCEVTNEAILAGC